MNQDRRAKIETAVEELRSALETMQELHATLESLRDEEQEAFDNLPEGLQQADRGQSMEAIASALDDAVDTLSSALGDIDNVADDFISALDN
jgi:F0F1-type ATP synthase membrane subunit b/b'